MLKSRLTALALTLALTLSGAASWLTAQTSSSLPPAALTADTFTVVETGPAAFDRAPAILNAAQLAQFADGKSVMLQLWSVMPSALGLWGRGPLSNGEACTDCHAGNGRGTPPEKSDAATSSMLVQISVPGTSPTGGPVPHPSYGSQLQHQGVLGYVPAEAEVRIEWRSRPVALPDGTTVELREPKIRLSKLAYGDLSPDTMLSARVAPPMIGMGLLEAIPESRLLELVDAQRGDAIRGRINYVWNIDQERRSMGRFGWKANHPNLSQQVGVALHQDLGVTSRLLINENCTNAQRECLAQPLVQLPEISDQQFVDLLFYVRALAVPARRDVDSPQVKAGEALFDTLNCVACHTPEHRTGPTLRSPSRADQIIRPYSDMLLHDMGPGLADGRPDFDAGPQDWRTPPLWGLGLNCVVNGNDRLLHDGRARNIEEAILWHDGEAKNSREAYAKLSRPQREALAAFVKSL